MRKKIRFIALDMDGTLYNHKSQISDINQDAIRYATAQGVEVVISTGRPYAGLPVNLLLSLGIRYAITANGAAIYRLSDRSSIFSNPMKPNLVCPILRELQKKDIHIDAFIDGDGYSLRSREPKIRLLDMPESIRQYIRDTRIFTDDLADYIMQTGCDVQKIIVNFYKKEDGSFPHRDEVKAYLSTCPKISYLSGGYHNLEFTRADTSKGTALSFLCEYLDIPLAETMACGDTQNDIDILKTAAVGVAMGNAKEEVKAIADYITCSNEEHGVSHAIRHFIGES